MKNITEKIFYYLMSVCFMNLIFLLRFIPTYIMDINYKMSIISWICFSFVALLFLLGIIASIFIAIRTSKFSKRSLGIEYKILNYKNHTGEQYFTHFSLLVLTAFAIPYTNILFDIIFIFLIHILLCFIYIRENLYHINPTLNILRYRIYECHCISVKTQEKKMIYIFARNFNIEENQIIKLKSNNSQIIRINNKQSK